MDNYSQSEKALILKFCNNNFNFNDQKKLIFSNEKFSEILNPQEENEITVEIFSDEIFTNI